MATGSVFPKEPDDNEHFANVYSIVQFNFKSLELMLCNIARIYYLIILVTAIVNKEINDL